MISQLDGLNMRGAIPSVFDDTTLSVWEMLNKILNKLTETIAGYNEFETNTNKTITDFETAINISNEAFKTATNTTVQEYITAYNTLKSYVDTYFVNLNVQNEINSKLNNMVTDGTLDNIINHILFGNILKKLPNLKNVKEYGIVDDGITDNTTVLQGLIEQGAVLYFPYTANAYHFTSVNLLSDTKIIGDNAKIDGIFNITSQDNIVFDGLSFINTITNAIKINVLDGNNVTIKNCKFNNSMVYFNSSLDLTGWSKNININNCLFNGDSSNNNTFNAIQILGYKNVKINNNTFDCQNFLRVLKLTTTTLHGEDLYTDKPIDSVLVDSNTFINCITVRQIIDLFAGIQNAIISNNIMEVTNCSCVIEAKDYGADTYGAGQAGYTNLYSNISINNNNIKVLNATEHTIMLLGRNGTSGANFTQNCSIQNNIIEHMNGCSTTHIISIYAMNKAVVKDNTIKYIPTTIDINTVRDIIVGNTDDIMIINNIMDYMRMYLQDNTVLMDGTSATNKSKRVLIDGNLTNQIGANTFVQFTSFGDINTVVKFINNSFATNFSNMNTGILYIDVNSTFILKAFNNSFINMIEATRLQYRNYSTTCIIDSQLNTWDLISGTTAQRPTSLIGLTKGTRYFDTTLNKPIWYNGTAWVDSAGTTV